MKIEISKPFGFSFIGRKPNNEDSIYPNPEDASLQNSLFLVCDGVGGREKGEVASAAICETLSHCIQGNFFEPFSQFELKTALAEVYNRLNELEDAHVVHKMGSTLAFLKFHSGGAMIAHIGDSRVYHIRPEADQPILFRTEDHSLIATMVKAGMITAEEAAVHPKRNVIHRAVQPHQAEPAEADIFETADIEAGDYFFLCSDGVLENLTEQLLVGILKNKVSDKVKLDQIRQICEDKTNDNYSAWLIRIKSVLVDKSIEAVNEVIVLKQVQSDPLTKNGKAANKSSYFRKNLKSVVMLVSLLLVVVIAFILYTKNNSKKPYKQSEPTRIIAPTADSATSKQKQAHPTENQTKINPTHKNNTTESQADKEPKNIMIHKSDSTTLLK